MAAPDSGESSLVAALSASGLDVDDSYWKQKLKDELGIVSYNQVKHVGDEERSLLESHCRYKWETKALNEFLTKSTQISKDLEAQTSQKDIKQLLQQMHSFNKAGKSKSDKPVEEKLSELKDGLAIDDHYWESTFGNVSLDETVTKLNSFVTECDSLLANKKPLSPVELVKYASAGILLRGIYVSDGSYNMCGTLLNTPTNIELKGKLMNEEEKAVEFSSRSDYENFHSNLKNMGYSCALKMQVGYQFLAQGKAQISSKVNKEESNFLREKTQQTFKSRTVNTVVPMASMELDPQYIKLTDPAIGKLKKIDSVIGMVPDETIQSECMKFMKEFGSHICTGIVHFGGIHHSIAEYESESSLTEEKTNSMLRKVHNAHLKGGYDALPVIQVSGQITGEVLKNTSADSSNLVDSEEKKVIMKTIKTGGPHEATSVPSWKKGLSANETWSVIDRGNRFPEDFTGIWDLIRFNSSVFSNASSLAKYLQTNWKESNTDSADDTISHEVENVIQAKEKGYKLVNDVKIWLNKDGFLSNAVGYLKEMCNVIENIHEITGDHKMWTHILQKEECITKLFKEIINLEQEYTIEDCEMVKGCLKILIEKAKPANFPEKNLFIDWIVLREEKELALSILSFKPNKEYLGVLQLLDLVQWYPGKISIENVIKIDIRTSKARKYSDLPWLILRKLTMLCNTARDDEIKLFTISKSIFFDKRGDDDSIIDFEDLLSSNSPDAPMRELNPLDAFVAIFGCCDLMLKQVLVQSLFMCHLAIPLIYPLLEENSLMYSLWCLRTLVIEWRYEKKALDKDVVSETIPTISVFRCGPTSVSKSKCLNNILTSGAVNTFSNRYTTLGEIEKKISNGLVDCSFYIPSYKQMDVFEELVMFLNLRGDAKRFKNQVNLMSKMATITIMFVNIDEFSDGSFFAILHDIFCDRTNTIIVLNTSTNSEEINMKIEHFQQKAKETFNADIPVLKGVNEEQISKQLGKYITDKMNLQKIKHGSPQKSEIKTLKSISEWSKTAKTLKIKLDEDCENCVNAERLADSLFSSISEEKADIDCFKKELLPLQEVSRSKWSTLLKATKTSTRLLQKDHIKKSMQDQINEQLNMHRSLSKPILQFITILTQNFDEDKSVMLSLQWLKIYLDKLSRQTLHPMYDNYRKISAERTYRLKIENQKIQPEFQREFRAAETHLTSFSFGVEHLFREVGQIYETMKKYNIYSEHLSEKTLKFLPKRAAMLLLNGHPLEIMDGDAACVPLTWVKAVLNSVIDIVGDKRVLVLSILGVRSSGTYTMLKAMFGLSFDVVAGRCTRAAFLYIFKVDSSRGLPFDFLFIINTEGFKSPGVGIMRNEHDNELCTFAVGLGDLTLLNMRGEELHRVRDVLQNVVHAFLRISRNGENILLKKKNLCIIHNVSQAFTKIKDTYEVSNIQNLLDSITRREAVHEYIFNVNTFNHIIDFNQKKDLWYISDLYQGDPPITPVNASYSERASKIKENILRDISLEEKSYFSISEILIRLEHLWTVGMKENFKFSSVDSLTSQAHSDLEVKLSELVWNLESKISFWMENTAKTKINQAKECNIEEVYLDLIDGLSLKALNETIVIIKNFKIFLAESTFNSILFESEEKNTKYIKKTRIMLIRKCEKKLKKMKEERKSDILKEASSVNKEEDILNKVMNLSNKMIDKRMTEATLEDEFYAMWEKLINDYTIDDFQKPNNIKATLTILLVQLLPIEDKILYSELERNSLSSKLNLGTLEGSLKESMVEDEFLVHRNTNLRRAYDKVKLYVKGKNKNKAIKLQSVSVGNKILVKFEILLNDLKKTNVDFQKSDALLLIKSIVDDVHDHNETNISRYTFTLQPLFTLMLCIHACKFAIPVFEEMANRYRNKHSLQTSINRHKTKCEKLFKNMVKKKSRDVIAADILCDSMEHNIKLKVKQLIDAEVVDDIVSHFNHTKNVLMHAMLDDMAVKGSFTNYKCYLTNPKTFALKWITAFTDLHLFNVNKLGLVPYGARAELHMKKIILSLKKGIKEATEFVLGMTNPSIEKYVNIFFNAMKSEVPLTEENFREFLKYSDVNFKNLHTLLLEKFQNLEENIVSSFKKETEASIEWPIVTPYQQALDKLWGCDALCPFCKEPCKINDSEHTTENKFHRCIQHKPRVICRVSSVDTEHLYSETCNSLVQSDHLYNGYPSLEGYSAPFKLYKDHFSDWFIRPFESGKDSKYWMWVVEKFKNELADMYGVITENIPKSWAEITVKEARESLNTEESM